MTATLLLVSPFTESRRRMEQWLRKAGFSTESVATFEAARARLTASRPDVLVSAVRLGEYNGLHLAIVGRSRRPSLVAIMIGPSDAVVAKEAQNVGATFFAEPTSEEVFVAAVMALLQEVGRSRRWPRKLVDETVKAEYGESSARIVDLSYGGLRLEITDADVPAGKPGSDLLVSLPAFGVSVDAALIWAERVPSGYLHCGAAVNTSPTDTVAWRQIVDRIGLSIQ